MAGMIMTHRNALGKLEHLLRDLMLILFAGNHQDTL